MIFSSLITGNLLRSFNTTDYFYLLFYETLCPRFMRYSTQPFLPHLASFLFLFYSLTFRYSPKLTFWPFSLLLSPPVSTPSFLLAISQAPMASTIIPMRRTHKTTSFEHICLQICISNCLKDISSTSNSCVHNQIIFSIFMHLCCVNINSLIILLQCQLLLYL